MSSSGYVDSIFKFAMTAISRWNSVCIIVEARMYLPLYVDVVCNFKINSMCSQKELQNQ